MRVKLQRSHQVRRERLRQRREKVEHIMEMKAIGDGDGDEENELIPNDMFKTPDVSVMQPLTFEEMMGAGYKVINFERAKDLSPEKLEKEEPIQDQIDEEI